MSLALRRNLVQSLFDETVVVEVGDPREPAAPLSPAEALLVTRAVQKRKLEFAKGRECARNALARLGISGFSLLTGPRREPLWPAGVVGSVTHCATFCAVAVARHDRFAGLGLDAEIEAPVEPAVQARVCTAEELARLGAVSEHERGIGARLVFSAKEAFYKAQFAVSGEFLGFFDAVIDFDADSFSVRLQRPVDPFPLDAQFSGRWIRADGLILTAVAVPHGIERSKGRVL